MTLVKKGDRIQLKKPLINGWQGVGTVIEDQTSERDPIFFRKNGQQGPLARCFAMLDEVKVLENYAPNYLK